LQAIICTLKKADEVYHVVELLVKVSPLSTVIKICVKSRCNSKVRTYGQYQLFASFTPTFLTNGNVLVAFFEYDIRDTQSFFLFGSSLSVSS